MIIKHKHTKSCPYSDDNVFIHYLTTSAPDFLWFDVQDVGSYQGSVFGVALYKNKIAIYRDYYGSCSGCGAWGEGGEPKNQEEVIKLCTFHIKVIDAVSQLAKLGDWDKPDIDKMTKAIKEVDKFRTTPKVKEGKE